MKRLITVSLLLLVALATRGSATSGQGYMVTDLGIISGGYECFPRGMNDNGWVVGSSTQRKIPHYKGWLWTPTMPNAPTGSLRPLEPLAGCTYSWAADVNNAGLCVGYSYGGSSSGGATFWQGPNYAPVNFNSLPRDPLDPSLADWQFLIPWAVSDPAEGTGEIIVFGDGRLATDDTSVYRLIAWHVASDGTILSVVELAGGTDYPSPEVNGHGQGAATLKSVTPTGNSYEACVWDLASGQATHLGALTAGMRSWGRGIDDFGNVVGESDTLDPVTNALVRRGFVWTPSTMNGTAGTMIGLGTLGGTRSAASGINHNAITNADAIVGWATTTKRDNAERACIWQKAALTANGANTPVDLNTLKSAGATGLTLVEAYRTNNKGAIIGATQISGAWRSFLLTPNQ